MKKLLFIIFVGLPFFSKASPSDSLKTLDGLELTSSSKISIGSTHLPINFFRKIYYGGFINEKDKGKINPINSLQRSGLEIDINVGLKFFLNKKEGWYINYQIIITNGLQYNQGIYDAIFRGNIDVNETIFLNKTSFHSRNHQLFQFGKFNENISYGITVGNILQEINGHFGPNDFINFTNPYEWDIITSPNVISIQNTKNIIKKNGNSIGLNLKISKNIAPFENLKYNFEIKNLGWVYLYNNIEKVNFDTALSYSGLSLDQISSLNDSNNIFNNIFSKQPFSKNMSLVTPFEFNSNIILNKNKIEYYSGFYYRHNSQYFPKIYCGLKIKNNNKLNFGSILSYGGYNKFQIGFNSEYQIKNFGANLILQNFLGLIPSFGESFGIFLNLSWKII